MYEVEFFDKFILLLIQSTYKTLNEFVFYWHPLECPNLNKFHGALIELLRCAILRTCCSNSIAFSFSHQDEFDTRLAIAVKLARSEWEEIAQEETETAIEHAIEECNRKNKVQNQTAIQEAVMNAKNQWDSNAKSLSDNQKCSSREVELLKREIDLCQAEIFRIKAEAEERENELKNEIEEMQVKHEEMVNDAVANAKVRRGFC